MPLRDDKDRKLLSYADKEYAEMIEFPVELVDRDGVVRRYSYRESLAVYQRRLASAPLRYRDSQLVAAEISHCTRRIDQIQRSYRLQGGGGGLPRLSAEELEEKLGRGAAELLAHYQGLLRQRGLELDRLPVKLFSLDDSHGVHTWQLAFDEDSGSIGHLLYVVDLAVPGAQASLSALDAQLAHGQEGEGVERLLWSHVGEEVQLLLSGDSALPSGLLNAAEMEAVDQSGRASAAVAERIIDVLKEAVERGRATRDHYLGLMTLLENAGRTEEMEEVAGQALDALEEDAALRYHLGLWALRGARRERALELFEEAGALDPELYQARYFAALLHGVQGQLDRALALLDAAVLAAGGDPRVERARQWVLGRRRARRTTRILALVLLVLGVLETVSGRWLSGGLTVLVAVLLPTLGLVLQERWARVRFSRSQLGRPPEDVG